MQYVQFISLKNVGYILYHYTDLNWDFTINVDEFIDTSKHEKHFCKNEWTASHEAIVNLQFPNFPFPQNQKLKIL